jgi:ADP-ribose pyrophosphatase YjhB (NUDIX family)
MARDATEVIVRGLAVENGHVLLCRHVGKGYRYLPGGHVEFPEPARDALAREMDEEAGVTVRTGELLLTHEHVFRQKGKLRHELNLVFAMTLDRARVGGQSEQRVGDVPRGTSPTAPSLPSPVPSQEPDIAFDWIALGALDEADVRPASMVGWIRSAARSEAPTFLSEILD